jgi:hypothetical protein
MEQVTADTAAVRSFLGAIRSQLVSERSLVAQPSRSAIDRIPAHTARRRTNLEGALRIDSGHSPFEASSLKVRQAAGFLSRRSRLASSRLSLSAGS